MFEKPNWNGKLDPKLTPEFKEAYATYRPALQDLATILIALDPTGAADFVQDLNSLKETAQEVQELYTPAELAAELRVKLLAKCSVACLLNTTQPFLQQVTDKLDELEQLEVGEGSTDIVTYIEELQSDIQFKLAVLG